MTHRGGLSLSFIIWRIEGGPVRVYQEKIHTSSRRMSRLMQSLIQPSQETTVVSMNTPNANSIPYISTLIALIIREEI